MKSTNAQNTHFSLQDIHGYVVIVTNTRLDRCPKLNHKRYISHLGAAPPYTAN